MTANYRSENPNSTKGHFFGKEKLQEILDQKDIVGVRIYYGIDEEGKKQLIIVGATADENDLVTGKILDRSCPCPTICGMNNPLNS
jgi:hypothetical protein